MALLARPLPIRFLLVALVAIAQVPAIVALGLLARVEYQFQREIVIDGMVERSRVTAVALRERIEKIQADLEELARAVPGDTARLGSFHALAASRLDAMGVDAIALVDPDGRIALNTRVDWGAPLAQSSPAALETFATGRRAVIDLTTGGLSRRSITGVGVPVVRDSRIAYALNAGMDPARFRDLLAQQQLPPNWIVAIVDSRGAVVARFPEHDAYVGRRVTADLADRIAAAGSGAAPMVAVFENRTLAGMDVVTSMRRSPVNGWTVVVSVPRSVLNAPVWRSLAWAAGALLLLLAASLAIARVIGRRITGSIGRLRDSAAALPAGRALDPGEMFFAEGEQLARTVVHAGEEIEAARRRVDGMTQDFNRTLMREIEARERRTARELHDSVGSSLAGVSLLLVNARARATDANLAMLLARAQEQVGRSAQEVREISRGMTPAGTEAGALVPAIEHLASELMGLQGVRCGLRVRGHFGDIPAEDGTQLYRIVQEACANAVRHGGASNIRITLVERAGNARLTIADDGKGCDPALLAAPRTGLGLRSMHARARAIDGRMEVSPGTRGGCRVRVAWTLRPPQPSRPASPAPPRAEPRVTA